MKENSGKKQKRKLILSLVALALSGAMSVASALAWFSMNSKVSGGGMALNVETVSVSFYEEVTVTRIFSEDNLSYEQLTYKRADDGKQYYQYENGGFVLENGEKIPLALKGILPGERIDFTVQFKCSANMAAKGYRLYFKDFDDVGDDAANPMGRFSVGGVSLSILGIYKVGVVTGKTGATDGTVSTWTWLSEYGIENVGETQVVTGGECPQTVEVATGDWTVKDAYIPLTFRLSVDLAQYALLKGTTSNLLSEKTFSIGTLGLGTVA